MGVALAVPTISRGHRQRWGRGSVLHSSLRLSSDDSFPVFRSYLSLCRSWRSVRSAFVAAAVAAAAGSEDRIVPALSVRSSPAADEISFGNMAEPQASRC